MIESFSRDGDCPGTFGSFAASWIVIMAAMMLASALPVVYEFARRSEGEGAGGGDGRARGHPPVDLVRFGLVSYAVLNVFPVPPAIKVWSAEWRSRWPAYTG